MSSVHTCKALVSTCIDFRIQPFIDEWIGSHFEPKEHDRIALAGGVKDLSTILNQIAISKRLHQISQVILMNHEDCGAYGEEGTKEVHAHDLTQAKVQIETSYPDLEVQTYLVHLDGLIEPIS